MATAATANESSRPQAADGEWRLSGSSACTIVRVRLDCL